MAGSEKEPTNNITSEDTSLMSEEPQELIKDIEETLDEERILKPEETQASTQVSSDPEYAAESERISSPEETGQTINNNVNGNKDTPKEIDIIDQQNEIVPEDVDLESSEQHFTSPPPDVDTQSDEHTENIQDNESEEQIKVEDQLDQVKPENQSPPPTPITDQPQSSPEKIPESERDTRSLDTGQQTKDDLGLVGPKTDREERLASAPPRLGTDEMCQVDTILQDLWHCAVAVGTDIPLTECQTDPSVVDTAICDTVFEEHSYIKQNSLVRITLLQLPNTINLSSGKEHCLFPPTLI